MIDVDVRDNKDGRATLAELTRELGPLPDTVEAVTGSLSTHLLFTWPGERVVGTLGEGIDVKGEGGYFVAAPSSHASGREYVWESSSSPEDGVAVATLPDAWLERLRAPAAAVAPAGAPATPGGRPWTRETLLNVKSALGSLFAGDYDLWVRVGMACHHEGDGHADGFQVWGEWSDAHALENPQSKKINLKERRTRWQGFGRHAGEPVTVRTIYKAARAVGWTEPTTTLAFEPLEVEGSAEDSGPIGSPLVRVAIHPPVLDPAALHGVIGEYVRLVAPHTEASAAAILACVITALGALIGRGRSWDFGDAEHHARFWIVLVGPTGSGRKGTAIQVGARKLLKRLDIDFYRTRVASGLSSAEGLIHQVRDATPDTVGLNGKVIPGDQGEVDKRLLLIEEELAGPLEAMAREGNRLSAVLREAWDGRDLRSLVKTNPQKATAPHIALISCITPSELSKSMRPSAVTNGLANRFMPVWCVRSQLCPYDTEPDAGALSDVTGRLATSLDRARRGGPVAWAPAAEKAWAPIYKELAVTPAETDVVRALVQRGAAYVRRLAMLYALADGTETVDVEHLHAARAFWHYAAGTWRVIYSEGRMLSPLAERLLAALEAAGTRGCSRTELRDVAGSNDIPAEKITNELHTLATAGLAQRETVKTAGRPREVWRHARNVGAVHLERETTGEREESPPPAVALSPIAPVVSRSMRDSATTDRAA